MPTTSETILKNTDKADLNPFEQSIVHTLKTLPNNGWANQDILHLINTGRQKSVNPGRVNKNNYSKATKVDDKTLELYLDIQRQWDLKTGLNPYHHERLISAREAMIQAVQVFNNPSMHFKTQIFTVSAIIAWTYLFHAKYLRENETIHKANSQTHSLSTMLNDNIYGIEGAIRANLEYLIEVRNNIEHELLGQIDTSLQSKFQACAVNFNAILKQWFGKHLDLSDHLSFALQFANLSTQQLNQLQMQELPAKKYAPEVLMSKTYDFTVYYGQTKGSKSTSGQKFFTDGSEGDKAISNIVVVPQPSSITHPFKPKAAYDHVKAASKTNFNSQMHSNAWKLYKVRPPTGAVNPDQTNLKYCYYNPTYKGYSYNQDWIDFLVKEISEPDKFETIKNFKE